MQRGPRQQKPGNYWRFLKKKSPNGEKSIRHIAAEEESRAAVVAIVEHNDDLHDNGGVKFKAPRAEFVPQIRWITKQNRLDARPVIILFWWWRVVARVIYDRVLNEKNNFEIPAFFMFEQGKSRAGKFKPMLNYSINYFILNFPLLTFLVQT